MMSIYTLCIQLIATAMPVFFTMPTPVLASTATDALVGYWKMDETTAGATVLDYSGHARHGTPVSGGTGADYPQPANDAPANFSFNNTRSMLFDGGDDYIVTSKPDSDQFTISMWVKYDNTSSNGNDGLLQSQPSGSTPSEVAGEKVIGLWVGRTTRNAWGRILQVGGNVNLSSSNTATALPVGTWMHVTYRANGALFELFINGVALTSASYNVNLLAHNPIFIGTQGTENWKGGMDDLRIYNRPLSNAEIATLASKSHLSAVWNGTTSTNWESATNWNISAVPDNYTNVTIANTSNQPRFSSGIALINLHINEGATLDIDGFPLAFNESGRLTNSGTFVLKGNEVLTNFNFPLTGTTIFKGTGSYAGLVTGSTYQNIAFTKPGVWTLTNPLQAKADLLLSSGTLLTNAKNITLSGSLQVTEGILVPTTSTVTFDGNGPQAIDPVTLYDLTIENTSPSPSDASDVDAGAIVVTNALVIEDGQFQPSSNAVLHDVQINSDGILKPDVDADVAVSGSFTNDGTFIPNDGTLIFTSATPEIIEAGGASFDGMSFNGTGSWAVQEDTDINGAFTVLQGTFVQGANQLNIAGDTRIASGATFQKSTDGSPIIFDGDLTLENENGANLGNVVIGASPDTITLSGTLVVDSLLVTSGNVLITNGFDIVIGAGGFTNFGTIDASGNGGTTVITTASDFSNHGTFTAGSSSMNISGDLTSDGTMELGSDADITISGAFTNSGTFIPNDGTLIFTSATPEIIEAGGDSFGSITFDGDGSWAVQEDADINGSFRLLQGTFVQGDNQLNIGGDTLITAGSTFQKSTDGSSIIFDGDLLLDNEAGANLGNVVIGVTLDTITLNDTLIADSLLISTGSTLITNGFDVVIGAGGFTNFGTIDASGNGGTTVITTASGFVNHGTFTAGSSSMNISGDLTNDGTMQLGNGAEVMVSGSFMNEGTLLSDVGGTVIFTSATPEIIEAGGDSFGSITFDGDGSWSPQEDTDINGAFRVLQGTFVQGDNQLNIGGDTLITAGSTFQKSTDGSSIIFDGDLLLDNEAGANLGNVVIGVTLDTITLNDTLIADSLLISTGSTLITNGFDVSVGAGGLTNFGTIDASGGPGGTSTIATASGMVSYGTFVQGNDPLTITGDVRIASGSTFQKSTDGSSIIFGGNLLLDNEAGANLGNVVIGVTLDTITLSGTLVADSLTVTTGSILRTNGFDVSVGSGGLTNAGTIIASGGLGGASTVTTASGFVNPGTFMAGNSMLIVNGDFRNGGTFSSGTGTVSFSGSGQTLSGSTIFYNLTKIAVTPDTLYFTAEQTFVVLRTLILQGSPTALLSLRSTEDDVQWKIDPQDMRVVAYVDVRDSWNINATVIDAIGGTNNDSQNNINWIFVVPPPPPLTNVVKPQGPGGARGSDQGMLEKIMNAQDAIMARFTQGPLYGAPPDVATPDAFTTEAGEKMRLIAQRRGLLFVYIGITPLIFTDVHVSAWYTPFILYLIEQRIATGYADKAGNPIGVFGVDNPITLAEVIKMTLETRKENISGLPLPRNLSAQGTWAAPYVAKAEQIGVPALTQKTDVHAPATRGETLAIMMQVTQFSSRVPGNLFTGVYRDLPLDHPYRQPLLSATLQGLMSGDTDVNGYPLNTIRPDEQMNRAEAAKIIALIAEMNE